MNSLEWGMLILLSDLWGASFFFMKVALAELPTFTIVLSRVCIAALALLILIKATSIELPRGLKSGAYFSSWAFQ